MRAPLLLVLRDGYNATQDLAESCRFGRPVCNHYWSGGIQAVSGESPPRQAVVGCERAVFWPRLGCYRLPRGFSDAGAWAFYAVRLPADDGSVNVDRGAVPATAKYRFDHFH